MTQPDLSWLEDGQDKCDDAIHYVVEATYASGSEREHLVLQALRAIVEVRRMIHHAFEAGRD